MKRLHIHVAVDDLAKNIDFYSKLFGQAPAVTKDDYAKWMLDDPRVNFAISNRGRAKGLDHLGFQVESDGELEGVHANMNAAGGQVVSQTGTACCYAESDKHWTVDPQGIAWEAFHTLAEVPMFGGNDLAAKKGIGIAVQSACCVPELKGAKSGCC